ncbi:hypothetical protein OG218_01855 [Kineococcus sp. NBC_00420]|uniref:hypothetical protein n=1 Tax=Kineococcus sp. NBC_00420 TaxID=2903564 RepID=UPI002E22D695
MKTVLSIETARPVAIHELNDFFAGFSARVPGCFVSQGPSSRGRVSAVILSNRPIRLEIAEEVLESFPRLCDAITGLALQESVPRRPRIPAPA